MAWSEMTAFLLVVTLLVMSPGPNSLLIAKTVPTSGRLAGFANTAGFVSALFLHGALSVLGISVILVNSASAFALVKFLGAAYLCWIGFKALRATVKGVEQPRIATSGQARKTLWHAYLEGFLTNALNPKVSMFYLAAFPQFIGDGQTSASASFLLVFLHVLVLLLWYTPVILLFSKLTSVARGERVQRWLNAVTGVVFIGFGVKLASLQTRT